MTSRLDAEPSGLMLDAGGGGRWPSPRRWEKVDPWTAVQRLLGSWEGPATGRPGTGHQVREYTSILKGRFILGTDETHWVPTPDEPKGLVHEDLAVVGLDRAAEQLVERSFHGEGFVHEYRCVELGPDGSRMIFEAGQVENGPPGMRARETLVFGGPDDLESTFELAMPGGSFEPYTHEHLHRQGASSSGGQGSYPRSRSRRTTAPGEVAHGTETRGCVEARWPAAARDAHDPLIVSPRARGSPMWSRPSWARSNQAEGRARMPARWRKTNAARNANPRAWAT
jgi:hypothetical protein